MNLPCLVCGEPLVNQLDDGYIQPDDGVVCDTNGNYGSKLLDAVAGEPGIIFVICDPCLLKAADKGRVGINIKPIEKWVVTDMERWWVESKNINEYARKLKENGYSLSEYGLEGYA